MISRARNFIFVHVPKTAGNSLQDSLFPYSEDVRTIDRDDNQDGVERFGVSHPGSELSKHSTIADYRETLPPQVFDSALKFTILRNPWDRMVSFYFFSLGRNAEVAGNSSPSDHSLDEDAFLAMIAARRGYQQFICARKSDGGYRNIEEHDIDQFLRFEHLQEDYDALCSKLGLAHTQLIRRNASRHRPYASYYNETLRRAVAERFAAEIAYFGFSLDL